MQTLRIFVSSPGDVAAERAAVRRVIDELERSHLLRGKVNFQLVAWDDPYASSPMDAGVTPQDSVNRYSGRPSGCDLTLVILWSRIGTVLPPDILRADGSRYGSGTVWEFEDASSAQRPVWLYRRTSKPQIDIDDADLDARRNQYAAVKAFFNAFKNNDGSLGSGVNKYTDPTDFARQLRQHLEAFVNERLDKSAAAQTSFSPDHPQVIKILETLTTLTRQLDTKDMENTELRNSVTELSNRVAELETQLSMAVARTLTAAAQPGASPAQIAAAVSLQEGDTKPAEALMRDEERAAAEIAESPQVTGEDEITARRRAAELAREQGALAFSHDVRAALKAYQRAAAHDPEDIWTHLYVGDLHVAVGDLAAARGSFDAAKSEAEQRVATNDENEVAQHDLSFSHDRIGDVLVAQGGLTEALAAYRKSLAIRETLTARDAANTEWQRNLSTSHDRIGDVLVAQGGLTEALAAYRKSLAICETLAAHDAANTEWQRNLSISHEKIGDVLKAEGDLTEALAAYRKSLAIRETLTAHDVANTEWQRDLSVSHDRIGGVLKAQGDLAGALAAYRDCLAIAETLAARDPANVQWQIDVAVSCSKLGMHASQSTDERRGYLRRGLEILQGLKASGRLPPNQDWIASFEALLQKLDQD